MLLLPPLLLSSLCTHSQTAAAAAATAAVHYTGIPLPLSHITTNTLRTYIYDGGGRRGEDAPLTHVARLHLRSD